MPELPEIEVLKRSLEPHLLGERVQRVDVHERRLREVVDAAHLRRAVDGRRIERLDRRAKYLLMGLEEGVTVAVHLGMSGRLTVAPGREPAEQHEHVAFRLESGRRLRLTDPRRFGLVLALPTAEMESDRHFRHLGIEPLDEATDGAALERRARRRSGPVKNFLMNAAVIAGIGNIYACESLHRAGIHPKRSVARIADRRWELLAQAIRATLERAIVEGGTTLNDFADGEGRDGYFQVSLGVYGREGEACQRCGGGVRRILQAGRSTYYCPSCQR